jgi:hypothetical protein
VTEGALGEAAAFYRFGAGSRAKVALASPVAIPVRDIRRTSTRPARCLGLMIAFVLAACQPTAEMSTPQPSETAAGGPIVTPAPTDFAGPTASPLPPVVGPSPSGRVAAFYYPWYRTPEDGGGWDGWNFDDEFEPPADIASDYYPLLGPYSSFDPEVVAQHFAWLREADVGVAISSWWGRNDYRDDVVPLLLVMGERYGIKIAFHIEPYPGRTAERVVEDVRYLYERYGDSPAFLRTDASTRWTGDGSKGVFFLWAAESTIFTDSVEPDYWREAMDAIHGLPESGVVIANTLLGSWIEASHFDGLYNYATQRLEETRGFAWAAAIPPGAWYVPSVLPGFSANRIGGDPSYQLDRLDGATYDTQWEAALGIGLEPELVTITSFNEWPEGSQLEPAISGARNGKGYSYLDYGGLGEDGYLGRTADWVARFDQLRWPEAVTVQLRLSTTSDGTFVRILPGSFWMRPSISSASERAIDAGFQFDRLALSQSIPDAEAGRQVQVTLDADLAYTDADGAFEFEIDRGHYGSTRLEVDVDRDGELVPVADFIWAGIKPGPLNAETFHLPVMTLLDASS